MTNYYSSTLLEIIWVRRGRDHMVVGFTTTYAIGAYHSWCFEFDFRSGWGVQHYQGRIQDSKLGGALKKIALSRGRREHFWGILCEKSQFYAKKSYFFQIKGGARRVRPPPPWIRPWLCDKVCQWLASGRWFSPGLPVSSPNKTDRHDITEILLKVALNTVNQTYYK
jgi:hypothetical protein